MVRAQLSFWVLAAKTIVAHTLTYFVAGLVASTLFDYAARFAAPAMSSFMRQTNEPIVALGPALQPIRGVLFAVVFYLLREILFGKKTGWLITWVMLVFLGIFSTFGPAPGSVEGLIYTVIPADMQLSGGLLEVIAQTFLFSALLFYWVNHPEKRWLNWLLGVLFALAVLMSAMGFLMARR